MPTKLSPVSTLFPLTFLTLTLHFLLNVPFPKTHDPPLTLTHNTTRFTFTVRTARNLYSNRCALIRCTNHPVRTSCDVVTLQITKTRSGANKRLCVPDYVNTYYDSLSRTYNEGIFHVAPGVHLSVPPEQLPIEGKAVHFPFARNGYDVGTAWLALFPSNATRAVFAAWMKNIPQGKNAAPDQAAINRARHCRANDVRCHERHGTIRRMCDGVREERACASEGWVAWCRHAIIASTILSVVAGCMEIARVVAPRRTRWRLSVDKSVAVLGLGLAVLATLATLEWTALTALVGRMMGVAVRRRFDAEVLAEGEVFRGARELRGRWEGFAYVFADGVKRVRVAGPGASVVVWVVGVVGVVREAIEDGLLVRCLMVVAVVGGFAWALGGVGGKKNVEEEYMERRDAAFLRKKSGRSFLARK